MTVYDLYMLKSLATEKYCYIVARMAFDRFNPSCPGGGGGTKCPPCRFFDRCELTENARNMKFYDFSSNLICNI